MSIGTWLSESRDIASWFRVVQIAVNTPPGEDVVVPAADLWRLLLPEDEWGGVRLHNVGPDALGSAGPRACIGSRLPQHAFAVRVELNHPNDGLCERGPAAPAEPSIGG